MSSYNNNNNYDDDECDSNFIYRQRQAVKVSPIEITQLKSNNISLKEKILLEEEGFDDTQPLNLSLKPRNIDRTPVCTTIYKPKNINNCLKTTNNILNEEKIITAKCEKVQIKEEIINKENIFKNEEDSNDSLTDLNWLTNYNLNKDLKLPNFGCLSPKSDENDEADGNHRSLTSFIPSSLLHNMLVTHSKPPYSYSCLIFMSIESSTKKRLTVKEIYSWVLNNFPYFRSIPSGSWKNSIRHNLSHNKCFKKVDKNLLASRDFSGKGSLWCVNPECRMVLIETLKKMPQKAYSILQDVPESLGGIQTTYKTTSLKSTIVKSSPKITNVSSKLIQNREQNIKVDVDEDVKLTDFYKKACNESQFNDCSDFDAASALLMIKSANDSKTSVNNSLNKKNFKSKKKLLTVKLPLKLNKRNSNDNKKQITIKTPSNQTPCPNEDHTYSNALKRQQQQQESELKKESNEIATTSTSANKRKCRKKSEPSKVEYVEDLNNFSDSYSFNSDSSNCFDNYDNESDDGTIASQSNYSSDTSVDRASNDTLRNALLELSRAAELIEDKEDE